MVTNKQGVRNLDANPQKSCLWCNKLHRRKGDCCSRQCDEASFSDYVMKKIAGELD